MFTASMSHWSCGFTFTFICYWFQIHFYLLSCIQLTWSNQLRDTNQLCKILANSLVVHVKCNQNSADFLAFCILRVQMIITSNVSNMILLPALSGISVMKTHLSFCIKAHCASFNCSLYSCYIPDHLQFSSHSFANSANVSVNLSTSKLQIDSHNYFGVI